MLSGDLVHGWQLQFDLRHIVRHRRRIAARMAACYVITAADSVMTHAVSIPCFLSFDYLLSGLRADVRLQHSLHQRRGSFNQCRAALDLR